MPLSIVKKLLDTEKDLSLIGSIIDEGRIKRANFHCCQIQHIRRKGNEAAHNLANYGLKVVENQI